VRDAVRPFVELAVGERDTAEPQRDVIGRPLRLRLDPMMRATTRDSASA
jgi:hypothetical protein